MAKGKRVSNKPGGSPGRRATKGRSRFLAKRRASKSRTPIAVPNVIRGRGPAPIKKPPIITRAISHIKRYFRSK